MDLHSAVMQYAKKIEDLLVIINDGDDVALWRFDKGIVFVWAMWSSPAKVALIALADSLASSSMRVGVKLFVIDYDSIAARRFFSVVGHDTGGYGETFWIRDGTVMFSMAAYSEGERDSINANNRAIMS